MIKLKWLGEPIGQYKAIKFYKSCSLQKSTQKPVVLCAGDFVLIQVTKSVRSYGLVVNLMEDGDATHLNYQKTTHYRADILYLYSYSMLEEQVLANLRKLIRCRTLSCNELFIPCNTASSIVPNSMATIRIDSIVEKITLQLVDNSKKSSRPSYDVVFSRYGFSNGPVVDCYTAIKNSVNFIKTISGLAPIHQYKEDGRTRSSCSKVVSAAHGPTYNIALMCKNDEKATVPILHNQEAMSQSETTKEIPVKRKRGRPVGSLNKVKNPEDKPLKDAKSLPTDCSVLLEDVIPSELKNEVHKTKFNKVSCRDKEYRAIWNFLSNHLTNSTSGCMYVSGVPGTGKTHTTLKVIENLMRKQKFRFIHINGMKILAPNQIYTILSKSILGEKKSISQSLISLCNYFDRSLAKKQSRKSQQTKLTTILLIDELDCVCNRNQSVLYHLFEWTSYNSSKLVTLTIANTMDLPERYLSNKIASRLGLVRLTFQPYTYDQLVSIIQDIYVDSKFFEKDALQLISRKVAAVSGDVRRCLDVCQKSIEIAKLALEKQTLETDRSAARNTRYATSMHVSIKNVIDAVNIMFSSSKTNTLKLLSTYEQILLKCMFNWTKSTNSRPNPDGTSKSITLSQLKYLINCYIHNENLSYSSVTSQQVVAMAYRLINNRILKVGSSINNSIHTEVSLDIPPESIALALENA